MGRILPLFNIAFLLDIDGTLIDLAPTPETVTVPADAPVLLKALLTATQGATALVSGRSIDNIKKLFPDFAGPIVGQHGAERLVGGIHTREDSYMDMGPVEGELRAAIPRELYRFFENKGAALAIHTENNLRVALMDFLKNYAGANPEFAARNFSTISGHRVVELKPKGFSKGTGCAHMMALPAFQGRMPIYCGDDATDRDGFNYVHELEGLAVGVGPYFRDSSDINLDEPAKLRGWLKGYVTGS